MTLRIAWFATAKGTSSRQLLRTVFDAIDHGQLDAEIVCVVCNRERGQSTNTDAFLDDVERARIPLVCRSSAQWRRNVNGAISDPAGELAPWRRDFDRHLFERIQPFQPDIGMMAGYMMVVSDVICDQLPCLNLHPALPDGPIGTWQSVVRQLLAERATHSGMMLQRVTTELDRGPVVSWARYDIRGATFDRQWTAHADQTGSEAPLFKAIRQAGASREPIFILESLQAIASGRISIPDVNLRTAGTELTDQVEARMAN